MILYKYGVAANLYFPLIKRGAMDFAVSADYTHASGDVKISKDGGAAATATNSPSAITMGNGAMWKLTLTATEMQAAQVMVTVVDAATKAVEDQMIIIQTYGNASAQHPFDFATAVQSVNVSQINGDSTAPAQLAKSADTIISGTAQTGTLSSSQMTTNLTEATNEHYVGRRVIWTSGALQNQGVIITAYNGTTKMLTYTTTPTGESPANGDTFIIV